MKSSKRLLGGLLALLALAAPSRAWADGFVEWTNVCGTGLFTTCASVKVWVTGTTVKLQAWNLSGATAASYRGALFTQISLLNVPSAVRTTNTLNRLDNMTGPSYLGTGGLPTRWGIDDTNSDAGGTIQLGKTLDTSGSATAKINGAIASNCAVATPTTGLSGAALWMSRSCGPAGTMGGSLANNYAMEMTFSVSSTFDPGAGGLGLGITAVDIGDPTRSVYYTAYATPEPTSMLLLGSGLMGLGAAARRRRRRAEAGGTQPA